MSFRVLVHEYDYPEPEGSGKLINTETYTYGTAETAIEEAQRDREFFGALSSRFVVRVGDECFAGEAV